MTDKEFILFLVKLLWNEVCGDTLGIDDLNKIRLELTRREIDPDEAMPY